MRIGFLGKGGSGKTTVASAFIVYAAKQREHVLAIDADVNVHLGSALQMPRAPKLLGNNFLDIADYVKGERKDVDTASFVATTPPSIQSTFIRPTIEDAFVQAYASQRGNISLLTTGTYGEEDVGHTCYHGKLNALELIYHHLLDLDHELVVADTTAGIDNLGTSLFFAYDLNVFIVEPTQKSIGVYQEFERVAGSQNLSTMVIVNKAKASDLPFIAANIPSEKINGMIFESDDIRLSEQGELGAFERFVAANETVFSRLLDQQIGFVRDWNTYYSRLLETHRKNSVEWWNSYLGKSISEQRDPDFLYQHIQKKYA